MLTDIFMASRIFYFQHTFNPVWSYKTYVHILNSRLVCLLFQKNPSAVKLGEVTYLPF